jgi:molecular chaperone GrpE
MDARFGPRSPLSTASDHASEEDTRASSEAGPDPVPAPDGLGTAPPVDGGEQESDAAPGPGVTPGEGPAPEGDDQLAALTAKAAKADQYLALAQRTQADFENFRKRASRDAAAAQERGVVKLAKELLPAIDNLELALAHIDEGSETLVSGIKLVHSEVIAALARIGIEPYSPVGEQFDPQHHEAMAQVPAEGAEPGTIVEVYQRGYRLGDSVLRPARVVVAA